MEFNIHQLILADLATNIGESKEDAHTPEYLTAIDNVTSKVATRDVSDAEEESREMANGDAVNEVNGDRESEQRVFMVCIDLCWRWSQCV